LPHPEAFHVPPLATRTGRGDLWSPFFFLLPPAPPPPAVTGFWNARWLKK
jgi:hypothetical protein